MNTNSSSKDRSIKARSERMREEDRRRAFEIFRKGAESALPAVLQPLPSPMEVQTATLSLEAIIALAVGGQLVVPPFQRSYGWSPDHALGFLNAQLAGRTFGHYLFWQTRGLVRLGASFLPEDLEAHRLARRHRAHVLKLDPASESRASLRGWRPDTVVLDGTHRIRTWLHALFDCPVTGIEGFFRLDLHQERFVLRPTPEPEWGFIPLRIFPDEAVLELASYRGRSLPTDPSAFSEDDRAWWSWIWAVEALEARVYARTSCARTCLSKIAPHEAAQVLVGLNRGLQFTQTQMEQAQAYFESLREQALPPA